MKTYNRADFIKLPGGTIYSRVNDLGGEQFVGLFCKVSHDDENDWTEQDLIYTTYAPNIKDGIEREYYTEEKIQDRSDFRLSYDQAGRDGCYDEGDRFVVWDEEDVKQLVSFLLGRGKFDLDRQDGA